MMDITETLRQLEASGNYRRIPGEDPGTAVDMTSNDYLGLASRRDLRDEFFALCEPGSLAMSASASRLLGLRQREFASLEALLGGLYGREVLLFNSGYHANTGLIQALADKHTLIIADRLVHASIIDGIRLSGAPFERFRHNDYEHLNRIIDRRAGEFGDVLIIAESVYSMDGDRADIGCLVEAKRRCGGRARLYVDEAHAVGVEGPGGLGLTAAAGLTDETDIVVGTLGKALASAGAYAVMSRDMREFMVNRARSLIFSTALPPICAAWSEFIIRRAAGMDSERRHLAALSRQLAGILGTAEASHIRPLVVGDPRRAVALSQDLLADGFKVLPIRTPTVPPGTERLRFSLSASLSAADIERLGESLVRHHATEGGVGHEA